MLSSLIAERYAKALLAAARHAGQIDETKDDAMALSEALESDKSLRSYLTQPLSTPAEKTAVFKRALSGKVGKVFLQFLQVVLENKREMFLAAILKHYLGLVDEMQGRARAQVSTAIPLEAAQLDNISRVLGKKLGRQIELVPVLDRSMLGGLKLRLGDMVYDGSLDTKLAGMEKSLALETPKKKPKRRVLILSRKTKRPTAHAMRLKKKAAKSRNGQPKKKKAPRKKTKE